MNYAMKCLNSPDLAEKYYAWKEAADQVKHQDPVQYESLITDCQDALEILNHRGYRILDDSM